MLDFYYKKNVFVTGHTGFKGSWLCKILTMLGANVTGYALSPSSTPNLFSMCNFSNNLNSIIGDIRDFNKLKQAFDNASPEIVIHLAAQPIVKEGYENPADTYNVNVMGTVNILECIRLNNTVKSFVNVTTDKVYMNNEWHWGYRENDVLNGFDPYSNSKSCSELVTDTYRRSFFKDKKIGISTARAGNVIGGGDFAECRIIPDCYRAVGSCKPIVIRNPNSIRPYQFVLEPLFAYLLIVKKQYESISFADSYNIGPEDADCITTLKLADLFCKLWGDNLSVEVKSQESFHEASFLKLDSSKIKTELDWETKYNIQTAVQKTVEFFKCYYENGDIDSLMMRQIQEYKAVAKGFGVQ